MKNSENLFSRTCSKTSYHYIKKKLWSKIDQNKKKLGSKIDQNKPPEGGKYKLTTHPLLYPDLGIGYSNP
jgi:hypothetical protein